MKIISKIKRDVFNSSSTGTVKHLSDLFPMAPQLATKTIRLYPQNSLGFFTEGMGEIYDIKNPDKNVEKITDRAYKWKIQGSELPIVKFAARVTGGAITAGSTFAAQTTFRVAFNSSAFNPRDKVKLENEDVLFVLSEPSFQAEGVFEYDVQLNTADNTKTISTDLCVSGKEAGPMAPSYPELSDKGYLSFGKSDEWHVNYTNKFRYDWTISAEALATQFLIKDTIQVGKEAKSNLYLADELLVKAMEIYHFHKEMDLIYNQTTMGPDGKCYLQDPKTGQDIIQGDGIIAQMADSQKQTYSVFTLDLLEDIIADMALRMTNKTGNTILCTTGVQGYKTVQRVLRAEHKGFWNHVPSPYVTTKNGKIRLGAEYDAYSFMGNTIIFNVNNVFDHPSNPSAKDPNGHRLESHKMLFLDVGYHDGVKNLQMIAKDGRSFVMGSLKGLGGEDGKTSGDMYTTLDASAKAISGHYGIVMHNPYSSYLLEKVYI